MDIGMVVIASFPAKELIVSFYHRKFRPKLTWRKSVDASGLPAG
jgi:hypothetical protein